MLHVTSWGTELVANRGRQLGIVSLIAGLLLVVACSKQSDVQLTAGTATPTASVSATASATPEIPTPTPTPISLAGAPFPPSPKLQRTPPTNADGIKRIVAPRLHLDNYIETVPVISGEMQTPADANYAIGYYPDFKVKPGDSGNAIFSAHETWNHQQGPFYALHYAAVGDDIFVEMNDGKQFHYRVSSYKRYEVKNMPMNEILNPKGRAFGEQWMTLITCGGRIVYGEDGFGEYLDRDVVVAKLVK
ncbi:MAG: class F sortase [Chloroflexi bacterium]|nr:MAG: class F sortase [Chloroflexota bacterium]